MVSGGSWEDGQRVPRCSRLHSPLLWSWHKLGISVHIQPMSTTPTVTELERHAHLTFRNSPFPQFLEGWWNAKLSCFSRQGVLPRSYNRNVQSINGTNALLKPPPVFCIDISLSLSWSGKQIWSRTNTFHAASQNSCTHPETVTSLTSKRGIMLWYSFVCCQLP